MAFNDIDTASESCGSAIIEALELMHGCFAAVEDEPTQDMRTNGAVIEIQDAETGEMFTVLVVRQGMDD